MTQQMVGLETPPPVREGEETATHVASTPSGEGFLATWRRYSLALWLAPVGIAMIAVGLYVYYQSLNLSSATIQEASALRWGTKLWPQTVQHLQIAFWSTVFVVAIAVPLGIVLTRPAFRRAGPYLIQIANSGQALPAYGLLILFVAAFGLGTTAAIWALVLYAILPVLRNTMVGLDNVDRAVIEAGRGMGMTRMQALLRIELPLAVPVILAGVRTALILNISMAALAFLIGAGGLGVTINTGLELQQNSVIIVGAVLVALLALIFDWIGAVAERFLRPRGL